MSAAAAGPLLYEDAGVIVRARDPGDAAELFARHVVDISYEHVEDDDDIVREHVFRPGVRALALPGRHAVLLVRADGALWEDV